MPNFNSILTKIKRFSGKCSTSADLEDVKSAVELAQGRIEQVLYMGKIFQGETPVIEKLVKANEGLGKISEGLNKVKDLCLDFNAAMQIMDAVKILSNDSIMYNDKRKAAASFDMLFQGMGRFIRFLPPPANQWGAFFENFNLFSTMAPKLDPELRWDFTQVDGWR
ncbi:MAG: hypothetical protein AAB336_11790 [Acidobacteriota bacterium]